jgi:hypothetical protein
MFPLLPGVCCAIKGPSSDDEKSLFCFALFAGFSIEQAVDVNENENEKKMKCILIHLLILGCGFASEILALRCASPDGLSVEDVRKGKKV